MEQRDSDISIHLLTNLVTRNFFFKKKPLRIELSWPRNNLLFYLRKETADKAVGRNRKKQGLEMQAPVVWRGKVCLGYWRVSREILQPKEPEAPSVCVLSMVGA